MKTKKELDIEKKLKQNKFFRKCLREINDDMHEIELRAKGYRELAKEKGWKPNQALQEIEDIANRSLKRMEEHRKDFLEEAQKVLPMYSLKEYE